MRSTGSRIWDVEAWSWRHVWLERKDASCVALHSCQAELKAYQTKLAAWIRSEIENYRMDEPQGNYAHIWTQGAAK